ncbi:MAG: hypothetical protein WDZ41_01925 [Candidatus Babeliales bacterium]
MSISSLKASIASVLTNSAADNSLTPEVNKGLLFDIIDEFVQSDGEVVYKAQLTQSGTDAPVINEYVNTGLTITAGYNDIGSFFLSGFSDLDTGKWEIEFSKAVAPGDSVDVFCGSKSTINLTTRSAGSNANGVLRGSTSTPAYYNVITVKKYA